MCFVQERSERLLGALNCELLATNLVICDCIGDVLDEPVQQSGVILIPQEFQQPILFGKRFEFYDDIHQLPTYILHERRGSGRWGCTNLQSASRRVRSV